MLGKERLWPTISYRGAAAASYRGAAAASYRGAAAAALPGRRQAGGDLAGASGGGRRSGSGGSPPGNPLISGLPRHWDGPYLGIEPASQVLVDVPRRALGATAGPR